MEQDQNNNRLCRNCTREIHRPVECATEKKWIQKSKDEAESLTVQWLLNNTKACPKCKAPIEKNQGCDRMTCKQPCGQNTKKKPCGFEYWWYCLEKWEGQHDCSNKRSSIDKDKNKFGTELERYFHYYERWDNNLSLKQKAIDDLNKVQSEQIKKLAFKLGETDLWLKFITEAWEKIIECRQVLRWTYVYGYYIPEEDSLKSNFFEHLQGLAESNLERLHKCAQNDLKEFVLGGRANGGIQ